MSKSINDIIPEPINPAKKINKCDLKKIIKIFKRRIKDLYNKKDHIFINFLNYKTHRKYIIPIIYLLFHKFDTFYSSSSSYSSLYSRVEIYITTIFMFYSLVLNEQSDETLYTTDLKHVVNFVNNKYYCHRVDSPDHDDDYDDDDEDDTSTCSDDREEEKGSFISYPKIEKLWFDITTQDDECFSKIRRFLHFGEEIHFGEEEGEGGEMDLDLADVEIEMGMEIEMGIDTDMDMDMMDMEIDNVII